MAQFSSRALSVAFTQLGLLLSSTVSAMPMDALLQAAHHASRMPTTERLAIEAGYDVVPDETAHVGPVRDEPEPPPVAISRYQGNHVLGHLRIDEHWSLDGGYWNRAVANKRDRNDIESFQSAVQYLIPGSWLGNRFALRLGYWTNRAETLTKSSYTRVSDYTINSLAVVNPRDEQTQLNLIASRELSKALSVTGFIGVGSSAVSYDRVEGGFRDSDKCSFRFNIAKDQGTINQTERCGATLTSQTYMPTEESIVNNVGVNPRDALEYSSIYYQLGGNAMLRGKSWRAMLGYEFHAFRRDGVDDQVEALGRTPREHNHTVTIDLTYNLLRSLDVFARAEYMTNRLLPTVPFAYNPFTAERFAEAGLFFNVGLRVGF